MYDYPYQAQMMNAGYSGGQYGYLNSGYGYQAPANYGVRPQMSPQAMPMSQSYASNPSVPKNIEWVEGQVGAIAFPMPSGWPANYPIALWDNTKPVIYWKSWNQMGAPNQLVEIPYTMPNNNSASMLPVGQSGDAGMSEHETPDMSQYVTRQDFDALRNEIRNMSGAANNGNSTANGNMNGGNGGNGNRGGNRNGQYA
jgi:hypothetical protein